MHRRTEGNAYHISHDALPTPMVAVLFHIVCLLGYGGYDAQQWADDREGKASTEMLYLVLALVRVVTFAHCLFQLTELYY